MTTDELDPAADDRFIRHAFLVTGFVLCLIGYAGAALVCDALFPFAPDDVWPVAACLWVLSVPALGILVARRRGWMLVAYALAVAAVIAVLMSPWHPRKRFVWDLHSVQPGMTVDEVEAILGQYPKGAGKKWGGSGTADYPDGPERARVTGTMTYRWNVSDPAYDSDWGQVTFAQGRVVEVRFLPD